VTATRITVTSILGTRWADWSSLEPFGVDTVHVPRRMGRVMATARIIGTDVSKNLLSQFYFNIDAARPAGSA